MTDGVIALDTSVAVPLLVAGHAAHQDVLSWSRGLRLALTAHSLAETYSVLTRLPGDLRVAPDDAVRLLEDFAPPLILSVAASRRVPVDLARIGIVGGAVYDGLVALAARAHGARIATRDARALDTYRAVGVEVTVVGTAEA